MVVDEWSINVCGFLKLFSIPNEVGPIRKKASQP